MSTDAESGTTWLNFVQAKRSQLGTGEALGISSEAAFRDAFEAICSEHREKWFTRLLSHLSNSYGHIIALAGAIDDEQELSPPDDVLGLFWAASFAPIQVSTTCQSVVAAFLTCRRVPVQPVPGLMVW